MLRGHSVSEMSTWQSGSTSITELLAALCDCSLSGVSWKRHSLGGISRVSVRRVLRRRAYGALLSRLFQDGSARPSSTANALANTPAHNKMLMISFDLRVSGCTEEAERLEKLLAQLHEMTHASGLAELDSVLELLVQLAGSVPPPASSFSRDYMRRVRPVLRRPPPGGYLSQETRRLESRAWALVCGEEWGVFRGAWRTLSLMDAPPGTGLPGLGRRQEGEERFDRDTRLSLFGALQHSRTADMDVRLDLPPLPSNAEVTGLSIRVPQCMDQSEDEGFQSASNLTPDSQSEPSPSPEVDVWEALRTFVPGRRRCWENVGCPPGQKESPYLTEAGREAFDQLYRLWEGELRNMLSSQTPSPLLPLPLDSQTQLVKDLLNVLIGVASTTFPLNEASVQFDVRPDVCVSGTSPESVSRLLGELAQYGTHYLRLSRFSLGAADKKGLVFQAFTGGLRRYLHYYRACVLSTPASLSLLTIGFHFRKLGRQLRYLSELCCVNGAVGVSQAIFPVGVKLLSYLYNEAQSNCSNENYPVLLSLLKSSCEPYTRFVSDWVYSGVFRDVYKEFMIQVNEDYLSYRDKHFWVQGYTLISQEAEDCVPVFLRHIANDVYICGKTINLLKICCPQHYIFCSELPVPRIAVIFSLQEMEQIEKDCAVYRGRMETIAKHSAVSREEQVLRTELARQELINQVRVSAVKTLESIRGRQVSQRLAEEVRKRERFEALRQQLELDQEWRGAAKRREQEDDFSFARELRDREQRLQALKQQLERRARMDLIAQYSRLSEEAAKRERRAMWKVQRIRLDEARVGFLQQDQQAIQALLKKYPLRHGSPAQEPPLTTEPPHHLQECHTSETEMKNLPVEQETTTGSDSTLPSPVTRGADALISDEIDITDFFPKPPRAPDSRAVAQALHDIGSDLPEISGSPAPLDYDFSSPYSPLECLKLHPSSAHPSFSHIRIRENVSEVQEAMPAPSAHGPASWSSFPLSQYVPSVRPAVSQHGCLSQGSAQPGSTSVASGYGEPVAPPAATLTEEEPAGEMREPNTATLTMHDTGEKSCDTRQKELVGGAVESEWKSAPATVAQVGSANEQRDLRQMTAEQDPAELPLTIGHSQHSDVQRKDGHISGVLGVLPSSSGQGHTADGLIRIDELVSEVTTSVHSTGVHSHISGAHIKIGKLVLEVTTPTPSPNAQGHASDAPMKMGALLSDVNTPLPSPGIHDHASDAHIRIGELVSDVTTTVPSPNVHGHASDAHIRIGELVSDVTTTVPSPNVHGHASDAHIRIGELVSDVTTTVPSPNIHGHASDAHIRIGELVSDVTTTVPSPNVHGHASDAHIRIGELVSEVTTTVPSPNVHGHASDAHIRIGELVSDVTTTIPSPNVHGHASDAHIKVGEFVSDVAASRPRWSKHGHSSDSTLKVGCVMPDSGLNCSPLPGSTYGHSSDSSLGVGCVVVGSDQASHRVLASAYGHSSDSTLKAGCVVSGLELLPSPLPGSAYGHSSDSTLGVGCVVAWGEPTRPPPLPGSAHGHSSDSSLGMGCVVHGVIPGSSYGEAPQTVPDLPTEHRHEGTETLDSPTGPPTSLLGLNTGLAAWARGLGLSPRDSPEDDYLLRLASQYQAEHYEDSYMLMMAAPDVQLLQQVTRRPSMALPMDSLHCATDSTAVQLSEMMPLPVLMKHSVTTPLITHLSLVNKAVVDYYFVELAVEKHFEALRHFLLMEDGEFALSLTDRLFEKLGSGQTPGELLTPLVLNSILNKAMQYSLHGDSELAANFTFALRYLPEVFHPHAPDSLNCLELRYKVDWPLNVIITDSCMNKYNRLFSFLLQLKHMVWSLSDVWFHLKRTALVKGAGCSVQFRQLQLYRHEMQHFVKVIQGYIANQILQVSWSEFTQKLSTASDLDTIHHTHAEYLNRAIFRALLTEKAAPVMNIIHSIFSLILKFRGQLVAQPWESQQGETVHPCFIAMQQSYNTFKYYSHFLFKVVSKLVDKGYQPHLEDFLLRLNFNNYYKDS